MESDSDLSCSATGIRTSIYNAVTFEQVEQLFEFMKAFQAAN